MWTLRTLIGQCLLPASNIFFFFYVACLFKNLLVCDLVSKRMIFTSNRKRTWKLFLSAPPSSTFWTLCEPLTGLVLRPGHNACIRLCVVNCLYIFSCFAHS